MRLPTYQLLALPIHLYSLAYFEQRAGPRHASWFPHSIIGWLSIGTYEGPELVGIVSLKRKYIPELKGKSFPRDVYAEGIRQTHIVEDWREIPYRRVELGSNTSYQEAAKAIIDEATTMLREHAWGCQRAVVGNLGPNLRFQDLAAADDRLRRLVYHAV